MDGQWRTGSILGSKNKINVGRNSILDDASQISKFQIEICETVFRLGSTFQNSISVIFKFFTSVKLQISKLGKCDSYLLWGRDFELE